MAITTEAHPAQTLDDFVEHHYPRLVGLLTLRTGDRALAEDLAQDSLVKLVQHWDRVGAMENPWAWLARVAVNASTSRWRRLRVAERIGLRLATGPPAEPAPDGLLDLFRLLDQLPDRQRTALILRHYLQLDVAETARAMGCAEGTIKALTHKARQTMRRLMEENPDD